MRILPAFTSIRARMLAWFGVTVAVLFAAFGVVAHLGIRDAVVPLARELSAEILEAHSAEIGRLLAGYRADVAAMAGSAFLRSGDLDTIGSELRRRATSANPEFRRLAFVDLRGDYVTSEGGRGNAEGRAHWARWRAQRAAGRDWGISDGVISNSDGEGVFIVTAVVTDAAGREIGALAANVSLATLSAKADAIRFGETGAGWIADSEARLIAHPDPALRMRLRLTEGAPGFAGLEAIGHGILRGEAGEAGLTTPDGRAMVASWTPIPGAPGWVTGVVMGREEWLGRPRKLLLRFAAQALVATAVTLLAVALLARRIGRPVAQLRAGVERVTAGDLEHRVEVRSGDEIQALGEAFNRMTQTLRGHVEQAAKVAAEREHVAAELALARRIQAAALPAPVATPGAELHGVVVPAREVSGDFYDWLPLPGGRVALLVGDVSGKGVSAALFAARAAQLMRGAVALLPPGEAVAHVNAELASANPDLMFVTLFLAVLDPVARELCWVNAGHNPPLLVKADGCVVRLDRRCGPALGPMPGRRYAVEQTPVADGDLLAVYTDGVTEAPGPAGDLLGEPWLSTLLRRRRGDSLPAIARDVVESVDVWQGEGVRFDDVTLVLARLGGGAQALDLPAHADSVEPVVAAARTCAQRAGLAPAAAEGFALATCEAVTNATVHALGSDPSRRFRAFVGASGGTAVLRLEDDGPPFDPGQLPRPDLRAPLSNRPAGGLGWTLIRHNSDAVAMSRLAGVNLLTLARGAAPPDVAAQADAAATPACMRPDDSARPDSAQT